MKKQFGWTMIGLFCLLLMSCEQNEKNARLQVWLTDGPGDYEQVLLDVEGIEIHTSANDNGQGWTRLEVSKGVYDLLKLTNGVDTLLAEQEIPAGRVSQIRLKLGSDNSVVVGGETFALDVRSGEQSGLKLQVHEELAEGIVYKILLDFDVARSVVKTGARTYRLEPVIRTITEAHGGAISGIVDPAESTPAIYAIAGDDTVATTYTDAEGHYLLRAIPAGTYLVTFEPNERYSPVQVEGVNVQNGKVTEIDTVTLTEN